MSLGREPSPMELFVSCTYGVKTTTRTCNSSLTTALNTSWYVRSTILSRKLLFSWIEYDDFFFNFQETYNRQLRERYGDDPSTHPDFDPDLWMEVGSSDGPDKNRVYRISNITIENLRAARSVSTVWSSQSVSCTQSTEFMALQQHMAHLTEKYERLSVDYEQLCQMVMDMRSHMGDTCVPLFLAIWSRERLTSSSSSAIVLV
jgi:hypothetical protein